MLKAIKNALPIILIIIFICSLFLAIFEHINGLGIFSINMAIIILALTYYKHNQTSNNKTPAETGMQYLHSIITNEKFVNVVIMLLSNTVLSIIEKSQHKTTGKQIDDLQKLHQALKKSNHEE